MNKAIERPVQTEPLSTLVEKADRSHSESTMPATGMPDIFSVLPQKQREELLQIITEMQIMRSHSGPLPTPEDIDLYNRHIPNGADRIMTMAEKQSDHRREMERTIVLSQTAQSERGQKFGLTIGIVGILTGAVVALLGHDWVGGGIAGATVISLVYAFISGQRSHPQPSDNSAAPSEE